MKLNILNYIILNIDKLTYYFNSDDRIPNSFNSLNYQLDLIIKIKDGIINL